MGISFFFAVFRNRRRYRGGVLFQHLNYGHKNAPFRYP
jgi:hypothetical protein